MLALEGLGRGDCGMHTALRAAGLLRDQTLRRTAGGGTLRTSLQRRSKEGSK